MMFDFGIVKLLDKTWYPEYRQNCWMMLLRNPSTYFGVWCDANP